MSAIRRMMMRATKKDGYITNGLVFHLDGIDRGTTDTTKWVDLVGGIVFTEPNGTSVHSTNHIHLTSSDRLVGNVMPNFPSTTHTIECVVEKDSSNWVFIFQLNYSMVSIYFDSGHCICGSGRGYASNDKYRESGIYTIGFSYDLSVINGQQKATKTNTSSWNWAYPVINSLRPDALSYSKNIDVYSIRVYNRLLTADEMLHNQRYDNERFNLGMTFPT